MQVEDRREGDQRGRAHRRGGDTVVGAQPLQRCSVHACKTTRAAGIRLLTYVAGVGAGPADDRAAELVRMQVAALVGGTVIAARLRRRQIAARPGGGLIDLSADVRPA
ncbi:hypothetical protein GCM10010532_017160 [Dactylosporangium siamense]|uniref:Uncharacterized protein n=1 Tax=Dactylosporangium siamense TaxID=685454 RepID=A0A919UEA6_9ACTN|nr:hypothetical protein Dsi01nite_064710 [Dactylosporangium siamense]